MWGESIDFNCAGCSRHPPYSIFTNCQAPASVVLNTGAPATFTVTVVTSGGAIVAPKITSHRSPPTPPLPGAFTLALGALFFILVLRFYREWGGSTYGSNTPRRKIAYAVAAFADIHFYYICSERLRRCGYYACSSEIFHSDAQRHFHSGHHPDSHQPFR